MRLSCDNAAHLGVGSLLLSGSLSSRLKTRLLLLLGLGPVLVQQLEELRRRVLVESVRELGDGRWDLEALVKDDLLALEADVLGPFHETCEVRARTDVLTYKDKISGQKIWAT